MPDASFEPGELTGALDRRLWTGRWLPPAGEPHATVLLIHGYGEHLGRYDHVVAALCGAGYAVEALDHHGHGRSDGRRAALRVFDHYVDDCALLLDRVLARHPARPVVGYGHSMGGLIAARLALRRQADLAGLILSAPAFRVGVEVSPLVRRVGAVLSRFLPDLPAVPTAEPGLLSCDPEVERRFDADPLCYHGRARVRFGIELERAAADALAHAERLTLPLLVMHGTDDRYTDPTASADFVARARSADKTFRAWPGLRHELHNEPAQADVLAAVLAWLAARWPSSPKRPARR